MSRSAGEPPEPNQARVGRTLSGKWRLDRLIDVGAMGAVYEATHRNGRRVAIKMLHGNVAANPEVRRRFLREGYVANRIDHPGAVAILDDDVAGDGCPFLVMELLDGPSLSAAIRTAGGRLPVPEALGVMAQVLQVLAAAHSNGIVHRDVKPGNIVVTKSGHAKLLDFGLARIRDGVLSVIPTAAGIVMGTAGYMAPEQARGQPDQIDARSDLFAVGAVLFRAVSGRRVHERATVIDTTIAAMKERAPSLAEVMPEAGPALVRAVDRALAFDKQDRWQTAREMFDALREALDEVRAKPSPPGRSLSPVRSDEPANLVVDIAFGENHGEHWSERTADGQGVIEGTMSLSIGGDAESIRQQQ